MIALPSKTAEQLYVRLTAVEKIQIRDASPGTLEHLRQTKLAIDNISYDDLLAVQIRINKNLAEFEPKWWKEQTWNF